METSYLIAKLLGAVYTAVGLGILLNKSHYNSMMRDVIGNATIMYFGGVASLTVGVLLVEFHNVWVQDWPVLITIIGWIALVKGVLLLLKPDVVKGLAQFWMNRLHIVGVAALVLGLILGYYGFMV